MSCYECVFKVLLITELLPTAGKKNSTSNHFPCQFPFFSLRGEEQSSEGYGEMGGEAERVPAYC